MAVTDGKINIYITEGDLPDELGKGSKDGKGEQSKSKESMFQKYLKHELLHLVRNTVHNMVNFSVNQIGNMRGDYAMQRDVENALGLGRQILGIGVAAAVGAKKGGAVGAVIGAGVGIVSNTINGLINIHNESVKYKKQNYEIAQLRARTGMNTLLDGSRGTLE